MWKGQGRCSSQQLTSTTTQVIEEAFVLFLKVGVFGLFV